MSSKNLRRIFGLLALLVAVALPLVVLGCSADSPSEPRQEPGPTPPGTNPGNATYNITIQLDPGSVPAGSTDPVQVTVQVRRTDNGQAPPNGTTAVVSANTGSFLNFGSTQTSVVLSLLNGQAVVNYFPPLNPGTALIQARLENSIGQVSLPIREADTFFIASVSPSVGSPNGGEQVTIQGGGFDDPVRVTFDGIAAQVVSTSANRIRVITPPSSTPVDPGETRTVSVGVTINLNEQGQQSDTLTGAFVYSRGGGGIQQPQVFSVSPASGPNEGGTRVRILGEGFAEPVQVFFGQGTTAANFEGVEAIVESVSPSEIVVLTPAARAFGQDLQNSTVSILVKNLENGFSTVAGSRFQYGSDVIITAVRGPGSGPVEGGTILTIEGQGFDEPVAVSLGGVGQSVISVTGTQIVFRTVGIVVTECPEEGFVEVQGLQVVNVETGDSDTADIAFQYLVPSPIITDISPNTGGQASNTQVTINGINFDPPVRVSFIRNGQVFSASVITASDGQIIVRAPSVPNDVFPEEACDANADGTIGQRYINSSFDIEVVNLSTGCSDIFPGAFLYRPSDTSCRNDVGPDDGTGDEDGSGDSGTVSPP